MKKLFIPLLGMMAVIMACNNSTKSDEALVVGVSDTVTHEKVGNPADVKADAGPFQVEALKYAYSDLEKSIDARTMELHFSKHYVGYINKLNKEVAGKPQASMSIEDILKNMDMSNATLRNNGGGFFNHRMYFATMSPDGGGEPTGKLAEAIKNEFGSFDSLKTKLSTAAEKKFGSGWAWLVVKKGKLAVGSTSNQDNPLMPNLDISGTPILGIDVWEHAYYLRYQNRRPDYLKAYFDVIDWKVVNDYYAMALSK
ncbi:superoxide dismutase [Pedobacter sp. MW01-1-1]|uniref:superoxide dismutase n=1 Tax=Pedobacter sp. MW01-1-1 TaxID=3383027 RepID=UPI003FEEFA51